MVMKNRRLAREMVPYLVSGRFAFDVRYRFKGNKIETKVPIALVSLELAVPGKKDSKYVRFQVTEPVMRMFIKDLRENYKKLNLLEKVR